MPRAGLLLLLALAGCRQAEQPSAPPTRVEAAGPVNPDAGVRLYRCDDGRTVQAGYPDRRTAIVDLEGHAYTLKAQAAASGVRYVGFGLQWWTKGDEARLARLREGEDVASDAGVTCRSGAAAPVEPPAPGTPGGLPDDRRPLAEGPFAATSAQGAAQVLQTYYALLESRQVPEAWRLWSEGAAGRPADPAALQRDVERYAEFHAQVGAPGAIEGAAGSLFVTVPVVIYGRLATGGEVHRSGEATLRRTNDVPGASAASQEWRIYRIELPG